MDQVEPWAYGDPVRGPLSLDDVEALLFRARTPAERRTAAAQLTAWAEHVHPDDEDDVTPASLLVYAAEMLGRTGDHDAALHLYRRASTAEGVVAPDVRCYLHHGLLEVGDEDGARALADELRRERPADLDVYVFIAEDYELAGDLVQAHRWLTMAVVRMDIDDPDDEAWSDPRTAGLLAARRRVRGALDMPEDDYDMMAVPPIA